MPARIIFLILLLSLPITYSWSQEITGTLQGRIVTEENLPLQAVNILVTSPSLQGTSGTSSDEQGNFRFPALPVGLYNVSISHISKRGKQIDNVRIHLGRATVLEEIVLTPQTIEMEEIVIESLPLQIDPTTTVTGTNLTREYVENLPVLRDFRSIAALTPQANTSYLGDEINIAGSTGMENMYYIDGVNTTDPNKARTSTNLPYNFIKEIQTKTGGYEAENRGALGGIVNVVTHSGGNQLSGQAFGFFTNQALRGDPKTAFVVSNGDYLERDIGFSLGGPVLKDKLWFYTAYNNILKKEDIEIPGFGIHEDHFTRHIFAGKLTWRVSDHTNMSFSVFGDPASQDLIAPWGDLLGLPDRLENIDPYLGKLKDGGVNTTLNLRHSINNNAFLEFSASYFIRDDDISPRTDIGKTESLFVDDVQKIWSGGYGFNNNHRKSRHAAVKLSGTWFLKNHTLKSGMEYEQNFTDVNLTYNAGIAGFVVKYGDSVYGTLWAESPATVGNRIPSFFVQDSWLIANRLRANIGLRWDGQYIIGSDGELAQRITSQFQPRIGFTYQIGKIGTQMIFGSFGRYYELIPTSFAVQIFASYLELKSLFDHNPLEDPEGGIIFDQSKGISSEVNDLHGQYVDEIQLGYKRLIGKEFRCSISGIYRNLGQVVEDRMDSIEIYVFGNPGQGDMEKWPKFTRKYTALELTFEKFGKRSNLLASYVLSRNHGNYPGLYNSEIGFDYPNTSRSIDLEEQIPNSTGLLPNDRTHVFKLNGSYLFDFGLTTGAMFIWQSGTPLTEYGGTSEGIPLFNFLSERGSVGRTPSIWDLNFRITYDLGKIFNSKFKSRFLIDLFHVASQRTAVDFDQTHYSLADEDGNQIGENPKYLTPTKYQPPMTVRLGLEIGF